MAASHTRKSFWHRHSLSIVSILVLTLWTILYILSDEKQRWGAFYGNAIADWTGMLVTVLATKWFYEVGSVESKRPKPLYIRWLPEFLHEHSLTIFILITGVGWVV